MPHNRTFLFVIFLLSQFAHGGNPPEKFILVSQCPKFANTQLCIRGKLPRGAKVTLFEMGGPNFCRGVVERTVAAFEKNSPKKSTTNFTLLKTRECPTENPYVGILKDGSVATLED